ncbi:6-phosphogluconate dehydrogenase [Streptomyces sp. PBH53]|uniref:NAD(P)-dependent oxidoreductase n=1 Tax=Streptomyces sp. PBH53 TaxID=1577075 RepID=UPI0006553850|nr:NAD(P)-dependent oxidoreductase [Streptomyces sp. PBH53]AKN68986.1 6-phosphogluconate dehydrogenase [Streptomyces sp. PBH53]
MTRVGVIGLGTMGQAMAVRLLRRGHHVTGWNRSADALGRFTAAGGTAAATPRAVARCSEVVLVATSDEQALREVTEGDEGVLAGLAGTDAVLVQTSTVAPEAYRRLSAALPPGAGLLDTPVMGSVDAVLAGRLTVFAGGPPELVQRCLPVLDDLGPVCRTGPLGSGSAAKLVANAALFGVLAQLGETLALADGLGLDRDTAFEVLAATPLAAQAERRRPSLEKDEYPTRFSLRLAAKDMGLIREAARRHGVELRLGEATSGWVERALAAGYGEEDYTVLLRGASRAPRDADPRRRDSA